MVQPEPDGDVDAMGFDRELILTFEEPISADDIEASSRVASIRRVTTPRSSFLPPHPNAGLHIGPRVLVCPRCFIQ